MGKKNESKVDYWLEEDGLILLAAWARDGCTFEEICDKIGTNRMTLLGWRKKYPEIARALNTGKEIVDYKVENALLKAALGYTTKEIKVTIGRKIFNGETVEMLKETTTREVAPNVTACMAWLNNRKHDQWKRNRDKVLELDEEDNNISITIVRGPKENDGLGDNVNQEVKFRPKTMEELEEEAKANTEPLDDEEIEEEEDMSCWDDWDENED